MSAISISRGNTKMGDIQSVSLPSGITCRSCDCQKKCYAKRLERLRPSVAKAYQRNYEILQSDPSTYWREVEASIMMSRFFRFHVSGDIPDMDYFEHMVQIVKRNPHCEVLCFTKKFEIVNEYINRRYLDSIAGSTIHPPVCNLYEYVTRVVLPPNLHMIFSAWVGLEMVNPLSLPEAHVRYRDGSTTAREDAIECNGNCTECAVTDGGCWTLGEGGQVVFNEH